MRSRVAQVNIEKTSTDGAPMPDDGSQQSIFISHTHSDEELAHAIRDAVQTIFGDAVVVNYSTNKELDGGIKPGDDWFRWIGQQVRELKAALILLTPASIQKPWVLWEGGAVAGAALADAASGERKLRPVSYKLSGADIPTPFGRDQVTDGLAKEDIGRLFEDLLRQFTLPREKIIRAATKLEGACAAYLARAVEAMRIAPLPVTEAAVQEWLERIDQLERQARFSETDEIHDWMNVAFGRGCKGEERPFDLRVHRRLGELYARAGAPDRAAREFELARQLAPRDIYVLRRLGKAYLDQRRFDDAGGIVELMTDLDPKAFVRNAENAALKARWRREIGDPSGAEQVLGQAFESNPTSYYLGDLLAQAQMQTGNLEPARATYRRVIDIIRRLRERNAWVAATGLTAAVAIGDDALQQEFLDALQAYPISEEQATSMLRGVLDVAQRCGADPALRRRIIAALGGEPDSAPAAPAASTASPR